MAKYALPLLTGGLNEVTRSDLIDDSELSICDNYNIEGDGRLVKRRDVSAIDFDDNFSTSLAAWQEENNYHAWRVEAWSPNFAINMRNHPTADKMLVNVPVMVVVNTHTFTEGGYEREVLRLDLWYRYISPVYGDEDEDAEYEYKWTNEVKWDPETGDAFTIPDLLKDANIEYRYGMSDIRMDIAQDRIVIADGVNVCHFITVDRDGVCSVGPLGFGSPTNKLRFTRFMDTTDDDNVGLVPSGTFSENEDDIFSVPGYLQATYTVVDRYGNESNPAPYSDTLHIDYFRTDESMDNKWLDYVVIKDLSIPIVGSALKAEELDEFKIYFRYFRYREGNIGDAYFAWTDTVKIIEKAEYGPTANTYRMDVPLADAVMPISYENDPAPYAHQIASLNGIHVIGDIVSIPTYPWNFKYQHPIEIKNTSPKHYVDAVIRIRLTQPPAHGNFQPVYECNEIKNLNLLDFFRYYNIDGGGQPPPENQVPVVGCRRDTSSFIRFFDTDQTTPLQVIARSPMAPLRYPNPDYLFDNDQAIDFFIKIPLLPASGTHTIYLCWTPIGPGFSVPPHNQHAVWRYSGVQPPYNWYPDGIEDIINPQAAKDYWEHSAIYYGAITSPLGSQNYLNPEVVNDYMFLNFRHQRIFQSKGVWHEDVLVASPGDANFLEDETSYRMTNRANQDNPGQFVNLKGHLIRGWNDDIANIDLHNYWSEEFDEEADETVPVVRPGEPRVRIPIFHRGAPPEGEPYSDEYIERTMGYGGYITTASDYQSTVKFGDLGGIDLYNRSFTIMFNVCFLNPLPSGDPQSTQRSRLLCMLGKVVGSGAIFNKLTLDVVHPGNDTNHVGRSIFHLAIDSDAGGQSAHWFSSDGVFVDTPPYFNDGVNPPHMTPEYEWIQNEAIGADPPRDPCEFGNPRDGFNANKFICLSIKGYEAGNDTSLSLWIYDQDTNDISYVTCPNTLLGGFLYGGFNEFNMIGESAFDYLVPPTAQINRDGAIIQQVIFEKDRHYDFTKPDDVCAIWNRMNGMPGFYDPIGYAYNGVIDGYTHDHESSPTERWNQRITFGKTTLIFSNRERALLKWSAIDGFAFPTLNVARLKEPITAIIPAPSFLRFKYANTFLVFTRNTIQRVQVYPDVGALAEAQADESVFQNVIAEKKNYGLLARDSLTLAGDSLYWLSEVGIVRWSGEGMEIISKNRVSPQLLPQVYGFVNPVDNQYIVGAPPDYLIDYWTPGPRPPWQPPIHGMMGGVPCCSCCMPIFLPGGSQPQGENFINCLHEDDCKARGGVYSTHMCEPHGQTPWWLPPDEWEWHRCTTCDVEQPDGWSIYTWCEEMDFQGEIPPEPTPPIPGCNENPPFSCYYDDINKPGGDCECLVEGFDDDWWGGRVCMLSTYAGHMSHPAAEILGWSGWPFSRYSEYGAGEWGAPEQNGYVFMNFHELAEPHPTGSGTRAFYDAEASGVGGGNDFDDPIGSCARFNVYYPHPIGFIGPPNNEGGGSGKDVWINGKDLIQRFGVNQLQWYPEGHSEAWGIPLHHHKWLGSQSDVDRWRWTFHSFGGGMAARVRDCPVPTAPDQDGNMGIYMWDGPRWMYTSAEVYLREYDGYGGATPAGGYNSVSGWWWIDTYLWTWSTLTPFPLEDSPYWGRNNLGYGRGKNPYRGSQTVKGQLGGGKVYSGRDDDEYTLMYGDYHSHNLDNLKFTRYTGFNVIWSSIGKKLNGDIVNWVINVDGRIEEWPGQEFVDYAVVRTKNFYIENGSVRKIKIDYGGDSKVGVSVGTASYRDNNYTAQRDPEHTGGGITITPKHYDPMNKILTGKSFSISDIQSNQWRGLAINKCTQFDLTINGADVINSIFYDVHLKSKVNIPEQPTVTYEKEGYLDPIESGRKKE